MDFVERICNRRTAPLAEDFPNWVNLFLDTSVLRDHLPFTDPPRVSAVYGLIYNNELVYIGRSRNVYLRLYEHTVYSRPRADGHWQAASLHPVPEADLDIVEFRLIRNIQPRWNSTYRTLRTNWDTTPIDEIASVLNVEPGQLWSACDRHGYTPDARSADIRQVIWCFTHPEK